MVSNAVTNVVTPDDLADPLQFLRDSAYQWGQLQAILYDPNREELFPQPFLSALYDRCRQSGRAKLGILEPLFCGQRNLGRDPICAYLTTVPLVILGEWRAQKLGHLYPVSTPDPYFHPLGFCFPTLMPNLAGMEHQLNNPNSIFGGYAFFQEAWGTPQQIVLTHLGLSFLFYEFRAAAIHGVRYQSNHLTARWMRNFGFRDLGILPHYLYRSTTGQLESGMISYCLRSDFADLLRQVLLGSQLTEASATWVETQKVSLIR